MKNDYIQIRIRHRTYERLRSRAFKERKSQLQVLDELLASKRLRVSGTVN
jgi:hypothetical protein